MYKISLNHFYVHRSKHTRAEREKEAISLVVLFLIFHSRILSAFVSQFAIRWIVFMWIFSFNFSFEFNNEASHVPLPCKCSIIQSYSKWLIRIDTHTHTHNHTGRVQTSERTYSYEYINEQRHMYRVYINKTRIYILLLYLQSDPILKSGDRTTDASIIECAELLKWRQAPLQVF